MSKILLADDHSKITDLLAQLLRDHNLTVVANWPDLMEQVDNNEFDLVVTDIVMPGYKEIVKAGLVDFFSSRELKTIFISGYSENSLTDLPDTMRFLKKPFSVKLMKTFVDKMLKM